MKDKTQIVYTEVIHLKEVNTTLAFLAKDLNALILNAVSPYVAMPFVLTLTVEIKKEPEPDGRIGRKRYAVRSRRMR